LSYAHGPKKWPVSVLLLLVGRRLTAAYLAREDAVAKFWLDPLRHDHSLGFRPAELRRLGSIIAEQQAITAEGLKEAERACRKLFGKVASE
jgi:hypothetical protein